jgi:Sigma-70 factor, region 1.2
MSEGAEMPHATRVDDERQSAALDLFGLYLDEIGRHPLLTDRNEITISGLRGRPGRPTQARRL